MGAILSIRKKFKKPKLVQTTAVVAQAVPPEASQISVIQSTFPPQVETNAPTARGNSQQRLVDTEDIFLRVATVLLDKFNTDGDMETLSCSINILHAILGESRGSTTKPSSAACYALLGDGLLSRSRQTGAPHDLASAIDACECALSTSASAPQSPHHARALLVIGEALYDRAEKVGERADLDQAIQHLRDAVAGAPLDAAPFASLGTALRLRFTRYKEGDLAESDELLARAVSLCKPTHPRRAEILERHASLLQTRFFQSGDTAEIEAAVRGQRAALAACPPLGPDRRVYLSRLAGALSMQAEILGSDEALDEAITLQRAAFARTPAEHPYRFSVCNNLAKYLMMVARYRRGHDHAEIVALYRESAARMEPSSPYRLAIQHNLADVLLSLFWDVGDEAALEESIAICRGVLASEASAGSPYLPGIYMGLARALLTRSEVLGDQDDLEEAIPFGDQAVDLCPHGHGHRPFALLGLAACVWQRYKNREGLEDLIRCIDIYRECLSLLTEDHPLRYSVLPRLARALAARAERLRSDSDTTEAITFWTSALEESPVGHHNRHEILQDLALMYAKTSIGSGIRDLVKAREYIFDALASLESADPQRCVCLFDLAEIEATGGNSREALDVMRTAIELDSISVYQRIIHALRVLSLLDHDSSTDASSIQLQVLDAYREIVVMLPRAATFGLDIQSRLRVLEKTHDLPFSVARHALHASRPMMAVELLEQTRGFFWQQTLQLRAQMDKIPGNIIHELKALTWRLESVSYGTANGAQEVDKLERERNAALARESNQQLDTVLEKIRALPGLGRFMLPDDFDSLVQAAYRGPIILLVSLAREAHALIVSSSGGVEDLELPDVQDSWLVEAALSWKESAATSREGAEDMRKLNKVKISQGRMRNPEKKQNSILLALWTKVVKPIINYLDLKPSVGRTRSRIWLCPVGQFSFLPMHAAGDYSPGGASFSDYAVPSYTPTIGALLHAQRQHQPIPRQAAKVLVAAVPSSSCSNGRGDLPYTLVEAQHVRDIVPKGMVLEMSVERNTDPDGGMTRETLLRSLPEVNILHLACHGTQNHSNPLESAFLLSDGQVSIATLMPIPLPRAFLAFLSACETAKGDEKQPDQTIHLAATMLFAGFKSVVATLWSMDDVDGPLIAQEVYGELFRGNDEFLDPDAIPYALDKAVARLRTEHPSPSRWAPYIHLGI